MPQKDLSKTSRSLGDLQFELMFGAFYDIFKLYFDMRHESDDKNLSNVQLHVHCSWASSCCRQMFVVKPSDLHRNNFDIVGVIIIGLWINTAQSAGSAVYILAELKLNPTYNSEFFPQQRMILNGRYKIPLFPLLCWPQELVNRKAWVA